MKRTILKMYVLIFVMAIFTLSPAYAVKQAPFYRYPTLVRYLSMNNVLNIKVRYADNQIGYNLLKSIYMPNLTCNEFSEETVLHGIYGTKYVQPAKKAKRINNKPSVYVDKLLKNNASKISVEIKDQDNLGRFIADIYIDGHNLAAHLVEKGYCKYIN